MKRINSVTDALNTNKVLVDVGGGIVIPLPTDGVFGGAQGAPGVGVPEGGTSGQVVQRTASGTVWVTPSKELVGLSSVDNTADLEKPVSEPQAQALATKADLLDGKVPVSQMDFAPVTPTNGARPVGKGELFINVVDYGATGDGVVDDSVAIQSAVDAAALAGGGEVFLPAGFYLLNATVVVGSNTLVNGPKATIHIAGNRPGFTASPGSQNLRLTGLRFTGTLPADDVATIQNQVGIKMFGTWDNLIEGLEVIACKFERVQGTAIQMQHVRNFRIQNNEIRRHGYAAIGGSSVHYGLIEGNDIEGTRKFPSYVANTYGIFLSTLEKDGPVGSEQNPRSQDVMVRNNRIRKQRWSCLDTHVGKRISFIGNHIEDSPASAINAVYISMTAGHPDAQLSPEDIVIEGNTITYPAVQEPDATMNMAILLRGSVSADDTPGRQRVTGIIRGNMISRYGRQDTSTSGAIFVGAGRGVIVEGNVLNECRSAGVMLYDSLGTVVANNVFIDLWRTTGAATAVYTNRTAEPTMDLTVTGNRFVRGKLAIGVDIPSGSSVNTHAIAGTNGPEISVLEGNNEWGAASFATAHTRYQVGTGRLRRMSASAAPTTGTWLTGEQVVNSVPAPGGYMGWVCTTNGTPGVWKGYGLIAA